MLPGYQAGVMKYSYKGIRCLKSPVDIAIYLRLLWDLKPRLILEIGTHSGGRALLFADLCDMLGLDAQVISIDLQIRQGVQHPGLSFLQGDVMALDAVLDALPPACARATFWRWKMACGGSGAVGAV